MNAPDFNMAPRLTLDERFGWKRVRGHGVEFWFKGYEQTRDAAALAAEAGALEGDRRRIESWLRSLDGFFALAVQGAGWLLAAVDRVRSIPLILGQRDGHTVLSQSGPAMEHAIELGLADVNPDGAAAIALAGFTIGADTLYRPVQQLMPGEYLLAGRGGASVSSYHRWQPWRPEEVAAEDLVEPLSRLHERLIEKLIASAAGRPILVPLSAGVDSRMILSGLVAAGYGNVRAFAYGLPGNREAAVSRRLARRMGVEWTFVPYSVSALRRAMASPEHRQYESYADSLTGIHFPQDYYALTRLMQDHGVGPDTIVVNGQSGDFITGNHIPPPLDIPATGSTAEARQQRVIETLIKKHFKQWDAARTEKGLWPICRRLSEEIAAIGGMPEDPLCDHGVYEYAEFIDRQSKYVVHGQRCYEFLGLDWRLPLWDREYLDFWEKAPLAAKRRQTLYRRVLERDNWAGVWRDVPVNPLRVRPGWLVPIRLALKALHAPLGRARWHRFERQYLGYWMAPLCSFAPWPYWRVARDRRGHGSALGWYAEAYLNRKGLAWNGQPLEAATHG